MKNAPCAIVMALSLLLPATSHGGGPEDPIGERLAEAQDAYLRTCREARETLLRAYDQAGGGGRARRTAFLKTQPSVGLPGSVERAEADPYQLDAYTGRYALASGQVLAVMRYDDKLFAAVPEQPVVEIVPVGENAFIRADDGLQYDFLMDEGGLASEVIVHPTAGTARRIDSSDTHVIRIETQVDGRSLLVLRGSQAQWLHKEHVVPGRHRHLVKPTVLNGVEWYPVWPDARGLENHDAWESDSFKALTPPLPRVATPVRLVVERARCPVRLQGQPCAENNYAAVIHFDDDHGGSDDYVVEIRFPNAMPRPPEPSPSVHRAQPERPAVPTRGLVAWYPFDGDARDMSGNGHHGEVHHAALTRDRFGKPDRAYNFLGNSCITIDSPPRRYPDQPLSISAWAHYAGIEAGWLNNVIICQDDNVARTFELVSARRYLTWLVIGKQERYVTSNVKANPGAWYHLAAVFDGRRHRLYVDGVLAASTDGHLPANNAQRFVIGKKGSDEQWSYFNGVIDDIRIYNRALTHAEVTALYHEGGFEPEPLTRAARLGRREAVRKFAAEGADVNARNKEGCSALHYSIRRGDRELTAFLLSRRASPNLSTDTGDTPLHLAASQGDAETAQLLLDRGAGVDGANTLEQRPLHVASALGHEVIVRALLEAQADVNARDVGRNTPLHRAAMYGHRKIAELLLAHGADPAAVTRWSWPPFRCARRMGHDELADLLAARYQAAKRKGVATYLRAKPLLDGVVTDGEYGALAPETNFVLLRTGAIRSPTQTKFHVAWDDRKFYLAIVADERNAQAIATPQRGRDGEIWKDDYVDIFIDTNHDLESYFQFAVNLNKERYDARCGPGCGQWGDISWNAEWEVAAKAERDHYVIEIAIPFGELKAATPKSGERWGLNIGRARSPLIAGGEHQEHSQWAMTPGDYHEPFYFGTLKFTRGEAKGGAK